MLSAPPGLYYTATVAGLMVLLRLSRQLGAVFLLITFPVTLAHELTHLVLGYLTGGQPSGHRIIPRRSARGYILGSVTCNNVRWYNGLFIGLAPLLLLPLAFAVLVWRVRLQPQPALTEAAWSLSIAGLAVASLPSMQDILRGASLVVVADCHAGRTRGNRCQRVVGCACSVPTRVPVTGVTPHRAA